MTENEAKVLQHELEVFCRKKGLWCEIIQSKKPDLDKIEIKVSIKIK